MRTKPCLTLGVLATLGGIAGAEPPPEVQPGPPTPMTADVALGSSRSYRSIAENAMTMDEGLELSSGMKFITARDVPFASAGRELLFSDVGIFGVSARSAVNKHLELSTHLDLLAKQPSTIDHQAVAQGGGLGLRTPIGESFAIAADAGIGPLLDGHGVWTRESAVIEMNKEIGSEFLSFDLRGGADVTTLAGNGASSGSGHLTEVITQANAMFHMPHGYWAGWFGIAYAVPVAHAGVDPATSMAMSPQPRLDFHLGTVVALVPEWDVYIDVAMIDRGDATRPETQLPILDGGFDQAQVLFGVSRHWASKPHLNNDDYALRL